MVDCAVHTVDQKAAVSVSMGLYAGFWALFVVPVATIYTI